MDTALDGAVRVFCERGYHATSIGDLTAAMRLATGSVYKAFRDKHAVFLAAFERYAAVRREQTRSAVARGANGREQLRNLLLSYVEHSQGSEGRRGCIVVGSAVELSAVDPVIRARVTAQLKTNETFIAGLIREGQADGSIPGHVEADDTARLMTTEMGKTLASAAAEVHKCLHAGKIESDVVPLAETLTVMTTLDAVRAKIGLTYEA